MHFGERRPIRSQLGTDQVLVPLQGVSGLQRAVIQQTTSGKDLLVEGEGLREVMITDGVIGWKTTSNHVMEVEKVLGIEAARKTIVDQIQYTMDSHGLGVDPRHLMLLGDVMCFKVGRRLALLFSSTI